ncbi:sensor histidine kinase N-terminal domain-containing protein [Luteolibacter pohnpeiensis]|uniref:histidine kinase n=1 Tax=Luteolibacter pohnpeiensis TaxID=454153 RepID=A0A934S9J2_9BACT|nr:ATP-binding protein [Luteolibacter pohnpeiensis]MBK1883860.1 sensor histidine kinase N-terminal domain-containing protein [Luteolibacter pohnpeiensis]
MRSIRSHLTKVLCLSIGSLLVLVGIAIFFAARAVLFDQFDATLLAKGRALVTASEIDGGDFEVDMTVQDFAGFGAGGSEYFEICHPDGELVERSPSLKKSTARLLEIAVPDHFEPEIHPGKLADGTPVRVFVQKYTPKGDKKKRFQELHLVVASPVRNLQLNLIGLALVLAIAGAMAISLTIPMVRLVLKRGLSPLENLSSEVSGIAADDLTKRIGTAGLPKELEALATRLNATLAKLEESFGRERRFSSNAAHELRTPLAELKTLAELGATWPEEANPDRCAEMLTVIDELESLLEKLSLLARADAGSLPIQREPVSLRASILAVVDRFRRQAEQRELTFKTEIADEELSIDPVLWNAILGNLIGNAVHYTAVGGSIQMESTAKGFVIQNPAPDLTDQDLARLFDRFWRKDEARGTGEHSGLGLSIVNACVAVLGGTCKADLSPTGRFRVVISWNDQPR